MTAPSKTYTFETISDRSPSRSRLKKYETAWDVPKKSKKRRAIALVTLGDLWRPGSALGGYGGALGDPGGASGGSGGALEALEALY